jgi:hypothetical protein
MIPLLWLLLAILASPFKSKCPLEVENVALRHQVMVLRCSAGGGLDAYENAEASRHQILIRPDVRIGSILLKKSKVEPCRKTVETTSKP